MGGSETVNRLPGPAIERSARPVEQRCVTDFDLVVRELQRIFPPRGDGIIRIDASPALEASAAAASEPVLHDFGGQLGFLLQWQRLRGRPYWPGDDAGLTFDPGVDLADQDARSVRRIYAGVLDLASLALLEQARGKRGSRAARLARDPRYARISIAPRVVARILPRIAGRSWRGIVRRFPALTLAGVPPPVHTAMLSLSSCRGEQNPELDPLGPLIEGQDWPALGRAIGAMQQDHPFERIRVRRRSEAALILGGLGGELRAR